MESHRLTRLSGNSRAQADIPGDNAIENKSEVHPALQRKLETRHVTMISISGVIGTGLFLGTATALKDGGPLGMLLGYLFIGSICLATMLCVGEMSAFLPLPGGFIKLAWRFVDPAFAFAIGWNYWYCWTIAMATELTAAANLMSFWNTTINPAVWITMCFVFAIGINTLGVGIYGESEFWFSSIKVITIVGVIVLGIVVDLGGGPKHDRIGFRYWKDPGPFVDYDGFTGPKGHFLSTCSVVTQAMFAFMGTETVAVTAAEARNPRQSIPKAIKLVYFLVMLFYIGGVFIIGLLVPSNNPLLDLDSNNASASPFVIAFNEAGIKILPSILNAAILTSAWSASSSDLYIASRSLYGLAVSGSASGIFTRTTRTGLPFVAVVTCACFSVLAYAMTLGNSAGIVFTWLSGFSTTSGLITWFGIGVTYLRFYNGMRAQGIGRETLPFTSRLQPFAGWWCVCGSAFILLFGPWSVFVKGRWAAAAFVTQYLPVALFPILYFGAKFVMRVPTKELKEIDLKSNVEEFNKMANAESTSRQGTC